jgi:hypothetical protein
VAGEARGVTEDRRVDAATEVTRAFVQDARGDGSYLRATWHPERRAFVVSAWRGDVCTGAVRVSVGAAAELVHVLIDGLTEAARTSAAPVTAAARSTGRDVLARARAWIQRLRLSA